MFKFYYINFQIHESDVSRVLAWQELQMDGVEVPFKPARVLLQVK